jgi:dihydrofolate synthase/folylpolyglutamate synthase
MNQMLQSTLLYRKLQKQYSKRINLDLDRIKKVLKKLKNPQQKLKNPINFIGSDGKMSVLTSLKFFLEAENKKITTFTSPHLYDVRHRFWIKDKYISINQIKKLKKIIERTGSKLTLFELLTAIYILAAKNEKNIQYNLIESGLLFKKDSTNLWEIPKAQVITNINFQHQEWVKPRTLKEICNQKVGYLSKKTTIYIGQQDKKVLKIIQNILKKNPSKKIYSSNWKLIRKKNKYFYKDKQYLIFLNIKNVYSKALISNICLSIKIALDLGVKKETILKTVPKINFEGRIQYLIKGKLRKKLNKNEKLLIDGCHSIKSAKNLYGYLKTLKEPIYGIWGMKKNKNPNMFIKQFKGLFKKIILTPIENEPASVSSKFLYKIAKKNNYNSEISKNFKDALKKISSTEKKIICVFGSLYLCGNVLSEN